MKIIDNLGKLTTIPIIIGIASGYAIYEIYGGQELIKQLLSWTLGTTIIATETMTILSKMQEKVNGSENKDDNTNKRN